MKRFFAGNVEGLMVLALGLYLGGIIAFGEYWRYMNPRFEWITGGAVIMLVASGGVALVRSRQKADLSGILVFLAFLGVAALHNPATPSVPGVESGLPKGTFLENTSRSTLNGLEYIKINLADLTQHCIEKDPRKISKGYVTRGMVKRSPELDKEGRFALIRVAVVCCLAHALPVGLTVQWGHPEELREGQWVEVYGTLKELPPDEKQPYLPVEGFLFIYLNMSYGIVPTRIVHISPPETPYIFEFRQEEPYVY